MSEVLKTVKVKYGDSFKLINECDFDKEKHELYVEKKPAQQKRQARQSSKQTKE